MSLRNHIDIKRIKRLHKKKIVKEKILQRQQLILAELAKIEAEESRHVNWRQELEEGMTTASMGMINYPATGDVDIVSTDTTLNNLDSSRSQTDNYSRSGTTVTLQGTENQIVNGDHTYYNIARYVVNGSESSTLKVTIQKGGGTSSWTDRDGASNFDDHVNLNITDDDNPFGNPSFNNTNLTSGTHIIPLPGNYKNLMISFEQFGRVGQTGALRITNISLQRRTPLNVFVPLDDPEANAFIRGGLGGDKERKQKLKEQLDAGNELMIKLGLDPSKTSPGDIELAQHMPTDARDYTDQDDPIEDGDFPDDPFDDSDFPDLDLAMNQGPSTPVKQYDGKFMPNPGGGRPGKIRLKGKSKLA